MSKILFLKPQQLGLLDKPYNIMAAYSIVKRELTHGNNWNKWKEMKLQPNPFVRSYALYLLDAAIGHKPDASKIRVMLSSIEKKELNDIHNDYGEIIGPMFILSQPKKLFPTLHLSKTDMIYWPVRLNEPLYDFKIIKNHVEYKFSSKAGTTTNTIKPDDMIKLIDANPKLKKKWGNTPEYLVMKTLDEHPGRVGPFYALLAYNEKSTKKIPLNKAHINTEIHMAESGSIASMAPALKKQVIENLISAEKVLVDLSKNSLNYTDMFYEAISSEIFYINWLNTDSMGIPIFHTAGESSGTKDSTRKKVVFRSKNSINHARDKLGLQM